MKSKKRSKPVKNRMIKKTKVKKSGIKKKARPTTRNIERTEARSRTPMPVDVPISVSNSKTCEEIEVGDIGGFGSTEELESHEKRCTQPITQLCNACGKNLCTAHYELLHRDHDSMNRQSSPLGLAEN